MTDPNSEPPPLPTDAVGEEAVVVEDAAGEKKMEPGEVAAGGCGCSCLAMILFVVAFVVFGPGCSDTEDGGRDHRYPDAGDICEVARDDDERFAWSFVNEAVFDEAQKLAAAGDGTGCVQMILAGLIVELEVGTELLVIDRDVSFWNGSRLDVRVRTGKHSGRRLFMQLDDVDFLDDEGVELSEPRKKPRKRPK